MTPTDLPTFIYPKSFEADWAAAGLGDAELAELQREIAADPEAGAAIRGAGGARKIRVATPGQGKSGGLRVCYAQFPKFGAVYFLLLYRKSEKENLTPAEAAEAAELVDAIEKALERAAARRAAAPPPWKRKRGYYPDAGA